MIVGATVVSFYLILRSYITFPALILLLMGLLLFYSRSTGPSWYCHDGGGYSRDGPAAGRVRGDCIQGTAYPTIGSKVFSLSDTLRVPCKIRYTVLRYTV